MLQVLDSIVYNTAEFKKSVCVAVIDHSHDDVPSLLKLRIVSKKKRNCLLELQF